MVLTWIVLLAGSVLFGMAVVAAMVLPGLLAVAALALAMGSIGVALWMAAGLLSTYGTFEAVLAGAFFLLAGSGIGYRVAAAGLSHLGTESTPPTLGPSAGDGAGIILLADTDPERYDPRAVARRHVRLTDGAQVEIPTTAVPFVFLAAKARYRASRGTVTGAGLADSLAELTSQRLGVAGMSADVAVALDGDAGMLTSLVARQAAHGARTIGVVVLGSEDTDALDRAKAALDRARPADAGLSVVFGPSVWHDTALAARLVERILDGAGEVARDDLGVVLISQGMPPEWEHSHGEAKSQENYFNQRVRLLLTEQGIDERAVRIAWLDWQLPDVTEAVRHVAALGRTTIVIAPSTIALPTLESMAELDRAVDLARLPASVQIVPLAFWGDDGGFADAVTRSALAALGTTRVSC